MTMKRSGLEHSPVRSNANGCAGPQVKVTILWLWRIELAGMRAGRNITEEPTQCGNCALLSEVWLHTTISGIDRCESRPWGIYGWLLRRMHSVHILVKSIPIHVLRFYNDEHSLSYQISIYVLKKFRGWRRFSCDI
jgi:hypothetical protein